MSVKTGGREARIARRLIAVGIAAFGVAHVDKAGAAVPADPHFGQAMVASAGGLAAGHVLGGMTAQEWPVIVAVSSNARHMSARVALEMQCTSGDTFTVPDGWNGLPVSSSGVVDGMVAIPPSSGSSNSVTITGGQDSLRGRLNRKRGTFSGVWDLHLNYGLPNGQSDSCDSGGVHFTVKL